jgi:hypothetical protein
MDLDTLLYSAQAAVAWTLLLSALWKILNRDEFRRALPGRLASLGVAVSGMPLLELLIGAALIAPRPLSRPAALAAVVLLAAFTVATARSDALVAGCGCWPGVPDDLDRRLLLARNAVLVALAVAVAALGSSPTLGASEVAFGLFAGLLLAVLVMETPNVGAVLSLASRAGADV